MSQICPICRSNQFSSGPESIDEVVTIGVDAERKLDMPLILVENQWVPLGEWVARNLGWDPIRPYRIRIEQVGR